MKLTQAQDLGLNLIRRYGGGEVLVGEQSLRRPFLLTATQIRSDWPAQSLAALILADLEHIWPLEPLVVLMGTAAPERRASAAVRRSFALKGIALETMDLGAACRTYNVLVQESRPVLAALFPQET